MNSPKPFVGGIAVGVALTLFASAAYGQVGGLLPFFNTSQQPIDKVNRIMSVLDAKYVDTYDKEEAIESMYAGLVYGVGDPYTSYLDQDTLTSFMEQTEGTYAGIGVTVSVTDDNRITVIIPFEGAPGAEAGILPGDKIIKVNSFSVYGENYEEAVSMMKGEPGTSVNVTIYRESENRTFDVDIVRRQIDIPTVSHKMMEGNIGYIRVTNFERVTLNQFQEAYADLQNQNMEGLVLDLRNNPGGLLDVCTKMADMLVPEGYIVYTEDKQGRKEYIYSDAQRINVPLAILVNGNSASASEVVSGAVKDMGVGVLVGTQTFGKGLVQNLYDLRDGTALKITIAKYYTPSGVCINGEGITPDYIVDLPLDLQAQLSTLELEDDPQLQKALEVVAAAK